MSIAKPCRSGVQFLHQSPCRTSMHRSLTGPAGWPGRFPAAWLLAALWSDLVIAHHSFASIYDSGQTLALTGTVREFLFINPHPFLVVEVQNQSGRRETWKAE